MKTLKQNIVLIAAITMLFISCQKTIDTNTQSAAPINAAQADNLFGCNNCLVTHYQDDYLYFSVDVKYNNRREPDSIQTSILGETGNIIFGHYDKFGRLVTITFGGSQEYLSLKYDWSPLPVKMVDIVPNYADYGQKDSIADITYFRYSFKGEIIKTKQINNWDLGYNNITYNYDYDNNGNVKSVLYSSTEPGTPYVKYVFKSYDNKSNIMAGSIWLKYLLLNEGFNDLYPLLLSRNNAKDWTWYNAFQIPGANEIFTSTFTYNKEGFANTINLNVVDSVLGNITATRTAVSTCDNFATIPNHIASANSSIRMNALKQFNKRLPSSYYNRITPIHK